MLFDPLRQTFYYSKKVLRRVTKPVCKVWAYSWRWQIGNCYSLNKDHSHTSFNPKNWKDRALSFFAKKIPYANPLKEIGLKKLWDLVKPSLKGSCLCIYCWIFQTTTQAIRKGRQIKNKVDQRQDVHYMRGLEHSYEWMKCASVFVCLFLTLVTTVSCKSGSFVIN